MAKELSIFHKSYSRYSYFIRVFLSASKHNFYENKIFLFYCSISYTDIKK